MRVAWLILCYVLLESYIDIVGVVSANQITRHDFSLATNFPTSDNNFPSFVVSITNVTAAIGKKAVLSCTIRNLGHYKVGWLRLGDQTILSMGEKTVIQSPRFSVTLENVKTTNQTPSKGEEETTWRLNIHTLKEADRGCYMCQLNTNPMLNQLGCVDVLVPPDILPNGTSAGEVSVAEGENATLSCKASGRPEPRIVWKHEKNTLILMKGPHDKLINVSSASGERLELNRVDRRQMGAYLCIASNDVPPAVSKRVHLRVNFAPRVIIKEQILGTPINTNVTLKCEIEGFPKTINFWKHKTVDNLDGVLVSGKRYEITEKMNPDEEWKITTILNIKGVQPKDLGLYTCLASSSLGIAESSISLLEIQPHTFPTRATMNGGQHRNRLPNEMDSTTLNRIFHQLSTPAMQKSTARLVSNKILTTTMDPRIALTKNKNALKHNEVLNVQSNAIAINVIKQISAICVLVSFTLR
ncbi:lachesin-like isoform X2 [Leptopilina boulardi]|nr:lachesin-like isoform X2 [Leptopilina boulardi]XP_051162114.1 lachesin-like isoform X2 [Leptopilina boulardi]